MVRKAKHQDNPFKLLAEGLRQSAVRPTVNLYKPHEHQVKFHESTTKGTQFLGGNRSGKTVAGAVEAVWRSLGKHPYKDTAPPPVRGRSVSVDFTYGTAQIVIPELLKWIPPSTLVNGSWSDSYDAVTRVLTFDNGSTIEFRSYDQDLEKFAGVSRHWIWYDEEPPHSIHKECLMRLIDTGGQWFMTMTPVEGMTWTFREIYKKRFTDDQLTIIEVHTDQNPYLSPDEIDIYMAALDENDQQARKAGRYIEVAGVIWPQFGPHNVIDPLIPDMENHLHFLMMDSGYNNPTVFLWGAVDGDGNVFIYHEHYKSNEVVSWHANRVIHLNKELEVLPTYYVGDPAIVQRNPVSGTSVQLEYAEHGVIIMAGNNEVKAGINRVAEYLKNREGVGPRLYIARNCPMTLEEVPAYRWAQWATRKMREDRNPKEEPHKKDDHTPDALRYGIASRPEVDSGSEIPDYPTPVLTPTAADPYHRVDEGLNRTRNRKSSVDPHMGDNY